MEYKLKRSEVIAKLMAEELKDMAEALGIKPRHWHGTLGQHLVYGYERQIGFANGVALCECVENAWKRGQPIEPVIQNFFEGILK